MRLDFAGRVAGGRSLRCGWFLMGAKLKEVSKGSERKRTERHERFRRDGAAVTETTRARVARRMRMRMNFMVDVVEAGWLGGS